MFKKWADGWKSAGKGIWSVLAGWKYLLLFLFVALIFAFVLTINKDGTTNWALLFSDASLLDKLDLKLQLLGRVFTDIASIDGFLIVLISLLQGIAIAMLIYEFRHLKKLDEKSIWDSSVATVLAVIFSGCPFCGTALVIPLLTTIFASSAGAVFNGLSILVSIAIIVILLFAIRRLGIICDHKQKGVCDAKTGICRLG